MTGRLTHEACMDFQSTLTVSKLGESHMENSLSACVDHTLMSKLGSFRCICCGPDEI
jgi:hypothetical protein